MYMWVKIIFIFSIRAEPRGKRQQILIITSHRIKTTQCYMSKEWQEILKLPMIKSIQAVNIIQITDHTDQGEQVQFKRIMQEICN